MRQDRIRGIVAIGVRRGALTKAELDALRGAVHRSEVPADIADLARDMVTEYDAAMFRVERLRRDRPWWKKR